VRWGTEPEGWYVDLPYAIFLVGVNYSPLESRHLSAPRSLCQSRIKNIRWAGLMLTLSSGKTIDPPPLMIDPPPLMIVAREFPALLRVEPCRNRSSPRVDEHGEMTEVTAASPNWRRISQDIASRGSVLI
jgi:hypothetical protein